jgi:hypothetical protein
MVESTAVALIEPQDSSSYPATVTPALPVTVRLMAGGVTDAHPWECRLDPSIGVAELRWFQENLRDLAEYEGRWIAILGPRIVGSGDSLGEVRDQLADQSIRDALILQVQEDVARREYFIG